MNILITGASGFIGQSLVKNLTKLGHNTHTLGREACFSKFNIGQYDTLIHLAGRAHVLNETVSDTYQAYKVANVDYSLRIAALAHKLEVKKFIFLSSIGVNGKESRDSPFKENDDPKPHNDYAQTKLEAELALTSCFEGSNIALTIIRPPLVYGPNSKANFKSLLTLCRSPLPLPFGAVHNKRSLIGIDNLCHFIELCCTHPASANETFLISDDHDIGLSELVAAIRKTLNRSPNLLPVPVSALKIIFKLIGKSNLNQQLLGNLQIDTNKAKMLLNWNPVISFDEGINRAIRNDAS